MSKILQPGENTSLSENKGQVRVSHAVGNNLDINLTAFLVTESGKVVNDDDMVFLMPLIMYLVLHHLLHLLLKVHQLFIALISIYPVYLPILPK